MKQADCPYHELEEPGKLCPDCDDVATCWNVEVTL